MAPGLARSARAADGFVKTTARGQPSAANTFFQFVGEMDAKTLVATFEQGSRAARNMSSILSKAKGFLAGPAAAALIDILQAAATGGAVTYVASAVAQALLPPETPWREAIITGASVAAGVAVSGGFSLAMAGGVRGLLKQSWKFFIKLGATIVSSVSMSKCRFVDRLLAGVRRPAAPARAGGAGPEEIELEVVNLHPYECGVCLEPYASADPNRRPCTLPCQHAFCRRCLRDLGRKRNFHCPACRAVAGGFDYANPPFTPSLCDMIAERERQLQVDLADLCEGTLRGQPVALEFLAEADPAARRRLLRKALRMANVRDPHVATVYGVAEGADGTLALVRELGDRSAAELLDSRDLPTRERLEMARQLLLGLRAVHKERIPHNNLKLENVFDAPDAHVPPVFKLVDPEPAAPDHVLTSADWSQADRASLAADVRAAARLVGQLLSWAPRPAPAGEAAPTLGEAGGPAPVPRELLVPAWLPAEAADALRHMHAAGAGPDRDPGRSLADAALAFARAAGAAAAAAAEADAEAATALLAGLEPAADAAAAARVTQMTMLAMSADHEAQGAAAAAAQLAAGEELEPGEVHAAAAAAVTKAFITRGARDSQRIIATNHGPAALAA
eukprot:tig00021591_g22795.t1